MHCRIRFTISDFIEAGPKINGSHKQIRLESFGADIDEELERSRKLLAGAEANAPAAAPH